MVNLPQRLAESPALRKEVTTAIQAWRALRDTQWNNRGQRPALENILTILRFLGLQCNARGVDEDTTRSTAQTSPARRHFAVQLEQERGIQVRGIPQFGSNANNIYYIVCVWNHRPHTISTLSPVTSNARGGENAQIVIYLGGLTKSERNEIRRACIAKNLSFALLDELLFEFLSSIHRDSRFETFLSCALAYSASNPYIPEENWGASVPPEIFYGREDIAADIEKMNGGTHFLFGGRQVGKTALLQHIQRRGNDRQARRFTWFIDLRKYEYVMDGPERDPREVWTILLQHFKESGLVGEDPSQVPTEDIRGFLGRVFQQDPRLRVLAMFDEADKFLELDAASGSPVVESMRALMVESNNRLKVVFAGLHSVQRFARSRNTAYRNLRFDPDNPRRGGLGPLKYNEAQRFVLEPMRAVGIQFEHPLLVDTILTHTECHPSEIQFFCHRLVELLRLKGSLGDAPYIIRRNLVDEVAASRKIREGIRGRFDETFRLDNRYRAISLSMIYHFHGPEAAALGTLSIGEVRHQVLDLVEDDGLLMAFDEDTLSDLDLESLLNELVGLGILVQQGTGYRVRSQRIARIFGSTDDVLNEIVKLSEGR